MSEEKVTEQVLLEDYDDPDGILKKKKKNKNKVAPESDVVTSEEEKNMALKKVLELEKELLDMKSLKNDSDDQVKGLKYELKGLQKNFQELQESSTKSLEDLEKFEVSRLNEQVEELTKEKAALQAEVEKGMTQQAADQKEKELIQKELNAYKKEINSLKTKHEALEAKHEHLLKDIQASKDEVHNLKKQLQAQQEACEKQRRDMETVQKDMEKKKNHEKDLLMKELHNEREKGNVASTEMSVLKTEIAKMVKERDDERQFRLKTAERLKQIIEEKNKMEATYKVDMDQLTTDFEDMKNHLLHITTDKAEIFEKLSEHILEKENRARWVPDKETTTCTNCREIFTLTLRKHHCRICGHIFCFKCSDRWLLTPHSSKRVRACDVCADAYTESYVQAAEDKDFVDAPPQYQELKGDEIEKYEIEGEEKSETDQEEKKKE